MGGDAVTDGRETPAHGVRFEVARGGAEAEIVYRGHARSASHGAVPVEVHVTEAGAVARVTTDALPHDVRADWEKALSALVRAATRGPLLEGRALPRKITRWRPAPSGTEGDP
jgi:hypothetical protein